MFDRGFRSNSIMQVIGNSWDGVLQNEYAKAYFQKLNELVEQEYSHNIKEQNTY